MTRQTTTTNEKRAIAILAITPGTTKSTPVTKTKKTTPKTKTIKNSSSITTVTTHETTNASVVTKAIP